MAWRDTGTPWASAPAGRPSEDQSYVPGDQDMRERLERGGQEITAGLLEAHHSYPGASRQSRGSCGRL